MKTPVWLLSPHLAHVHGSPTFHSLSPCHHPVLVHPGKSANRMKNKEAKKQDFARCCRWEGSAQPSLEV